VALAEAKLAEAEAVAALQPRSDDGVFAGRYQWQRVVSPYDDADGPARPGRHASDRRLLRLEVTVAWQDGPRRRQLALATLRLAPAAP
jgi:hypothetical protein